MLKDCIEIFEKEIKNYKENYIDGDKYHLSQTIIL